MYGAGSRAHPSGAIPKTNSNSKFYTSDLSFEDDFNPSSNRSQQQSTSLSPKLLSNHTETVKSPVEEDMQMTTDGPEKEEKSPHFHASPLMCYVVRMKRGDELRKSLLSFAKKNGLKAAFIMTCVGSATSAKMRVASATPDNEANYVSCNSLSYNTST